MNAVQCFLQYHVFGEPNKRLIYILFKIVFFYSWKQPEVLKVFFSSFQFGGFCLLVYIYRVQIIEKPRGVALKNKIY